MKTAEKRRGTLEGGLPSKMGGGKEGFHSKVRLPLDDGARTSESRKEAKAGFRRISLWKKCALPELRRGSTTYLRSGQGEKPAMPKKLVVSLEPE